MQVLTGSRSLSVNPARVAAWRMPAMTSSGWFVRSFSRYLLVHASVRFTIASSDRRPGEPDVMEYVRQVDDDPNRSAAGRGLLLECGELVLIAVHPTPVLRARSGSRRSASSEHLADRLGQRSLDGRRHPLPLRPRHPHLRGCRCRHATRSRCPWPFERASSGPRSRSPSPCASCGVDRAASKSGRRELHRVARARPPCGLLPAAPQAASQSLCRRTRA